MSDTTETNGTTVEIGGDEQGLVVFDGTGAPLILTDVMSQAEVAEYMPYPVARRVLVTRLRAWADLIEMADRGEPSERSR